MQAAFIDAALRRVRDNLGGDYKLVFTGGDGEEFSSRCNGIYIEELYDLYNICMYIIAQMLDMTSPCAFLLPRRCTAHHLVSQWCRASPGVLKVTSFRLVQLHDLVGQWEASRADGHS